MHRQLSETMIQMQSWALEVPTLFTFRSGNEMQGEGLHYSLLVSRALSLSIC